MRAGQVLDMQADLMRRFEDRMFVGVFQGTMKTADGRGLDPATKDQNAVRLTGLVKSHLRAAYAYRVTPDMSLLVEHAAASLDETDLVDPSLAPTGCGIVRFDRPLPIVDARGRMMLGHWMTWGPASGYNGAATVHGAYCTWWNDLDDPDEVAADWAPELIEKIRPSMGRWSIVGGDLSYDGQRLGPVRHDFAEESKAQIRADGDTPAPYTNTTRYTMALWLLLNQTVTVAEPEPVDRPAIRRARRVGIPDRVTVIRLRRTETHRQPGETLVEWSHRWVVRGHWRWQPCGVGRGGRRRIWIAPHVKGPDDKPLVVTDKVYDLAR